jgi:hypothetical protein
MRNLILLQEYRQSLSYDDAESTEPTSASSSFPCDITFDPAAEMTGGDIFGIPRQSFVLLSSGQLLCCGSSQDFHDGVGSTGADRDKIEWVCDLTLLDPQSGNHADHKGSSSTWFQATFVDEIESIVVMSHSGVIATVSPLTGEATCVGVFDNGIYAAQWSPDMELVVLFTREGAGDDTTSVLLSMNTSFDIVAEMKIEAAFYPGLSQSLLQSGGDSSEFIDMDPNSISLCWKFDGQLVAASFVDASDSIRRIRLYKRETLELHGIGLSEDGRGRTVPNITPTNISWSGAECSRMVTAVQASGKKSCKVIFFEPNGLRHKDFPLRVSH